MKSKFLSLLMAVIPFIGHVAEFDSTIHFQVGTQFPEETSYMKFSGNIYDYVPDTDVIWVLNPRIYLNASVPIDFAGSAGIKIPTGPLVIGCHTFGHFHNFGDFPVNQFGHTFELIHNRFEIRTNYYHPAQGVFPISYGILSSKRIDFEVMFKMPHSMISIMPIYQFENSKSSLEYLQGKQKKWGYMTKIAYVSEKVDLGVEIYDSPTTKGDILTGLFMTFKFPAKCRDKMTSAGNNSSHYTNLGFEGPVSTNIESVKTSCIVSDKKEIVYEDE